MQRWKMVDLGSVGLGRKSGESGEKNMKRERDGEETRVEPSNHERRIVGKKGRWRVWRKEERKKKVR